MRAEGAGHEPHNVNSHKKQMGRVIECSVDDRQRNEGF